MKTEAMHYPFERGPIYRIGELRRFEQDLSFARQSDPALSARWRVPEGEMVTWGKIREELYPVMLLADHKRFSDEAQFRLMPEGHSGPQDVELTVRNALISLQVTNANPVRRIGTNGGYDHRLVMEALNRGAPVIGFGPFQRNGAEIVCGQEVSSPQEDYDACLRGLISALGRKFHHDAHDCHLAIFACTYFFNTIDIGFLNVVHAAIAEAGRPNYGRIYIFDENATTFAEI